MSRGLGDVYTRQVNNTSWLLAMNQAAPDLSISYNLPKSALEVNKVGPLFLRSLFLKADI